jgi:hypothetical protein
VTVQQLRAVLVDVGAAPRVVEAEPSALWATVGGIPVAFARMALTNYGKRFAAVWCSHVALGGPNRLVVAPMFRYQAVTAEIWGSILITAAKNSGEALALTVDEAATCRRLAGSWPHLLIEPGGCTSGSWQPPGRSRRCKLAP